MRYFLELTYNGSTYHGWQNQPNAVSVQEVVERTLSTLLNVPTSITGAGRTDKGVHAMQMFAHFDYDLDIKKKKLIFKLNSFLPEDISVKNIIKVKDDAHARYDALSRTYIYRIITKKDVFNNKFAYHFQLPLDLPKMNEACKILMIYKDFQCFSKVNTDVKTYICNIEEAIWQLQGEELVFTIKADRFLRNMVIAIVGTHINIGMGKLKVEDLHKIIASKDRSEAGYSVPAHGLYLTEIIYPDSIFLN